MGKVHALKARWLMIGSHLGGLQHLDVFSGAITLIVLSNNHIVVGPSSRIGMQLLNVKTHNEKVLLFSPQTRYPHTTNTC